MISPTAITALIFTFHDLSIAIAFTIAILFSLLVFWLYIRKRSQRLIKTLLTLIIAFGLGLVLAEKMIHKKPIRLEIVQAG